MKKLCNIHMRSTNTKSVFKLSRHDGLLRYHNDMVPKVEEGNQHLYITSDEPIKEEDWCYFKLLNIIRQASKLVEIRHREPLAKIEQEAIQKIIGTTDQSLKLKCGCVGMKDKVSCNWMCKTHKDYMLPQIPKSFIKEYVKAQGKITQVQVEYKTNEEWLKENPPFAAPYDYTDYSIPKLTPSNELIISLVEPKIYTRDEVIQKIDDLLNSPEIVDIVSHNYARDGVGGQDYMGTDIDKTVLNKWIEKHI